MGLDELPSRLLEDPLEPRGNPVLGEFGPEELVGLFGPGEPEDLLEVLEALRGGVVEGPVDRPLAGEHVVDDHRPVGLKDPLELLVDLLNGGDLLAAGVQVVLQPHQTALDLVVVALVGKRKGHSTLLGPTAEVVRLGPLGQGLTREGVTEG